MQPNQFVAQLEVMVQARPLFGSKSSAPQAKPGQPPANPIEAAVRVLANDLRGVPDADAVRMLGALLRIVRVCDRFCHIDGDDSTIVASRLYPLATLGALIAGHTNGARIRADVAPPYYNSGAWMPARTVPPSEPPAWLDDDEDAPRSPNPGTLARVELGDGPPQETVEEWPPRVGA